MKIGAFTFVLHSHMPFYRGAGRWPHGEENLHEVMAESYLPLLEALTDLHEAGAGARVTLGITPVLAEQLSDALVIEHFEQYLNREVGFALDDVERFQKSGDQHFLYLAHFYLAWYRHLLQSFQGRFNRNIMGAFQRLQDAGVVEILTSAATHAYLPLMERDSTIHAQLHLGKRVTERHFGKSPAAVWLPECAYRPAYSATASDGNRYRLPGLENALHEEGLCLFFAESSAMEGGTFETYYVRDSGVAVLGSDRVASDQVSGPAMGYPGDPHYREFYRKDSAHGFHYWRATDKQLDIAYKQPYEPYHAGQRAREHADHFVRLVESRLRDYASAKGKPGIVAAAYNTELFGHYWFEGVDWLKKVLAALARSETVELTTASAWLVSHPPNKAIDLPESSRQHAGTQIGWTNPETAWMWEAVHAAERRMEGLVARYPDASGGTLEALNQAARELMLLEASDWECLYTTGQARQYASGRFSEHADRFQELASALESRAPDDQMASLARAYNERDNLLPDIDYLLFARRQPD